MKSSPNPNPWPLRIVGLLILYVAELYASLWLAYELRFDFEVPEEYLGQRMSVLFWLIPVKLALLWAFHQLTPLPGYFSVPDLVRMGNALAAGAVLAWVGRFFPNWVTTIPQGVIAIDLALSLIGLAGVRLFLRTWRETHKPKGGIDPRNKRVAIIGAGDCGAILAKELYLKPNLGLEPVAFFDDDRRKMRSRLHDIPVLGPPESLLELRDKLRIEQAIIAMPSAPAKRLAEIVRVLRQGSMDVLTVPSIDQLALGLVTVSKLRHVEIHDLLGRDRVEMESDLVRSTLQDRVVVVTGAGGSIGSELCRQIAAFRPQRLVLVERSEPHLFKIEQELKQLGVGAQIVPLVADILDKERMQRLFGDWQPHIVFHAAAHKHVPMMESQPGEAIKNNTLGTALLAELAMEHRVERFVQISTDKAINPTNVMGATKRLAEIFLQSFHAANPGGTRIMAVRFGNVLGSSGSVIPIFREQIAAGGPVTVTDPEMTRYFMTIPEAVGLVLQSAVMGAGGEIFVLDMGKPVKILDLARHLIELSGLVPDKDIQIQFVGLRPGEKLCEELNYDAESHSQTPHPKIMRLRAEPQPLLVVRELMREVSQSIYKADADELKRLLKRAVPEYLPDIRSRPGG